MTDQTMRERIADIADEWMGDCEDSLTLADRILAILEEQGRRCQMSATSQEDAEHVATLLRENYHYVQVAYWDDDGERQWSAIASIPRDEDEPTSPKEPEPRETPLDAYEAGLDMGLAIAASPCYATPAAPAPSETEDEAVARLAFEAGRSYERDIASAPAPLDALRERLLETASVAVAALDAIDRCWEDAETMVDGWQVPGDALDAAYGLVCDTDVPALRALASAQPVTREGETERAWIEGHPGTDRPIRMMVHGESFDWTTDEAAVVAAQLSRAIMDVRTEEHRLFAERQRRRNRKVGQ